MRFSLFFVSFFEINTKRPKIKRGAELNISKVNYFFKPWFFAILSKT